MSADALWAFYLGGYFACIAVALGAPTHIIAAVISCAVAAHILRRQQGT